MNSKKVPFVPTDLAVYTFLVLITWIVFGRTLTYSFVNFDDRNYVYGNLIVTNGISWAGLVHAFAGSHAGNWHPLTTISHMLDCQIFGLRPGGHHLVNVLLHTLAVLLLFGVLQRMTGFVWRSAFVAAVFAIHPLRVESVAWIAERKDVLGALFFMLTLSAYDRFVRERTTSRYFVVFALFACGLMSKPMLVTLPLVLLLLDYWPLQRIADSISLRQVLIEKIPLFGLSIASSGATILAARHSLSVMEPLALTSRIDNAITSYITYIGQLIAPANLAVFYPFQTLPMWQVGVAAVLLIALTVVALIWRNQRPYLLVGWFWYLAMLIPVIGIIQIGLQGHADRYTYLPQIGLYLLITWSVAEMSILRRRVETLFVLSGIVLLGLAWASWKQVSYWKDSETLWNHTLAVTSDNDVAHNNLGLYYQEQGKGEEALEQYRDALKIETARTDARYNLSSALTYTNIANVLSAQGRIAEGVLQYQKAIELRPDYGDAHYNLGKAYLAQGRIDEAIAELQATVEVQPDDADAHNSLAGAYLRKKMVLEAIYHYEKAIATSVPSFYALNNLAWVLSTAPEASVRNGAKAVALARAAVTFSHGESPVFLRTLGTAYAETGNYDDAIKAAERALDVARNRKDVDLANDIEDDLARYRIRSPVRDEALASPPPSP